MSLMRNGDVCCESRFSVRVRRQAFLELGNVTVVDWVMCFFSLRSGERCTQYCAVHFESTKGNLNWFGIVDVTRQLRGFA